MITTRDIAARLHLSVSTVGRALADDPRISAETKSRVRQAADELGYVGNRAARMMRGASSNVVGLVIPDIRNTFYSTIAHELSTNLEPEGFQVLLSETGDDPTAELRHLRELSASRVAGAIIVPTPHPHPDTVTLLRSLPHIQLLREHPSLDAPRFGLDDFQTLRRATAHLVELGHTRVGYVGNLSGLSTGADRLNGFRTALQDAGLPAQAGMVELCPPSSVEDGRRAVRRLLALPEAPSALVTGSVLLTIGVLEGLRESGARVPDEVSVVGFGDEPGFSWWGPGLTTMGLPVSDLAASCARWLLHRLAGKPVDDGVQTTAPAGSLILRGSTGRPATGLRENPLADHRDH